MTDFKSYEVKTFLDNVKARLRPPRGWNESEQVNFIADAARAVSSALPRGDDYDGMRRILALAADRLVENSQHHTWPRIPEIKSAIAGAREAIERAAAREGGGAATGYQYSSENLQWIASFILGTWPGGYKTYPPTSCWGLEEARLLLDGGYVEPSHLEAIGWLSNSTRRELGLPEKPVNAETMRQLGEEMRALEEKIHARSSSRQGHKQRLHAQDKAYAIRNMTAYDRIEMRLSAAMRRVDEAIDEGDIEAARAARADVVKATAEIEAIETDVFGVAPSDFEPAAVEEIRQTIELWEARAPVAKDDAARRRFEERAAELRAQLAQMEMEESNG